MMVMAPGANTALGAAQCSWTLECGNPSAFGDYAAVALLPLDDKRHPKGSSTFPGFQALDAVEWWARENLLQLNLGQLPTGADRVLLVVYTFSAMGPVSDLRLLRLQIDSQIEFNLNLSDNGESAIIVGEFYCRNHQWKFRALAEGRPMA